MDVLDNLQGSAKRFSPGLGNAAGKFSQTWVSNSRNKNHKPGQSLLAEPTPSAMVFDIHCTDLRSDHNVWQGQYFNRIANPGGTNGKKVLAEEDYHNADRHHLLVVQPQTRGQQTGSLLCSWHDWYVRWKRGSVCASRSPPASALELFVMFGTCGIQQHVWYAGLPEINQ